MRTQRTDDLVTVSPRTTVEQGERLPFCAANAANLALLDADPRTAGSSNRPAWLVARVLGKAAR